MIQDKIKALLRPDVDPSVKLTGVSTFIGRQLDQIAPRLDSLEARQLQRGEHGEQGAKGDPGRDGKDGKDGRDGKPAKDGKDGVDGKDGRDGKPGKDGVSVVGADVALDGHLVFNLSNGGLIDAGELPKASSDMQHILSRQLSNYQITVSSDAPASPSLNDLWLPILE